MAFFDEIAVVYFPFFEVSLLVDADRIMRKNTSLLLDAVTNSKRDWSAFNCSRYQYQQLNTRKILIAPIFPKLRCLSPLKVRTEARLICTMSPTLG